MKAGEARKIADGALKELASALESGHSEALTAYLEAMGRFHRYSAGNVLLIYTQRPTATRVAGFHGWKRLGRRVKDGERGIRILAPVVCRREMVMDVSDDNDTTEEEDIAGFKTAYVFDVSQTAGRVVPKFACVSGDATASLTRLREHLTASGVIVQHGENLGGADGASCGGRILLRHGLSPAETFSTLVHELAHERLHYDGEKPSKCVRETEAESVAFVVCTAVGLDVGTASRDYIHLYRGDASLLMASLQRIRNVSAEIMEAITPERGGAP